MHITMHYKQIRNEDLEKMPGLFPRIDNSCCCCSSDHQLTHIQSGKVASAVGSAFGWGNFKEYDSVLLCARKMYSETAAFSLDVSHAKDWAHNQPRVSVTNVIFCEPEQEISALWALHCSCPPPAPGKTARPVAACSPHQDQPPPAQRSSCLLLLSSPPPVPCSLLSTYTVLPRHNLQLFADDRRCLWLCYFPQGASFLALFPEMAALNSTLFSLSSAHMSEEYGRVHSSSCSASPSPGLP